MSPPYAESARLILNTSQNFGANLDLCLLAAAAGSNQCLDGFPSVRDFLVQAGIDPLGIFSSVGDGGSEVERTTMRSAIQLLTYWKRQPGFARFKSAFGVPGVHGTESDQLLDSPARGKIFGKSGNRFGGDVLNGNRPVVLGSAFIGYLDLGQDKTAIFAIYVGTPATLNLAEGFDVFHDLIKISGLFWEDLAGH